LLPPIAAWNWLLQSEKAILAGTAVVLGLAEEEPAEDVALLVAVLRVVLGAACRLPEVHAVNTSPSRATARLASRRRRDRLVWRTRRGYRPDPTLLAAYRVGRCPG